MRQVKILWVLVAALFPIFIEAAEDVRRLPFASDSAGAVYMTPKNDQLVVGVSSGVIALWSTSDWRVLNQFSAHADAITQFAAASKAEVLVAVSMDQTLTLWDLRNWHPLRTLRADSALLSVAFSPDEKWLAAGAADGSVTLWDTETGKREETLNTRARLANGVAFAPAHPYLAAATSQGVIFYNVPRFKKSRWIKVDAAAARAVAFSSDGAYLAIGDAAGKIAIYSTLSRRKIITLSGHSSAITQIIFSSDHHFLFSSSRDGSARVWDYLKGATLHQFDLDSFGISGIAFSPDQRWLAAVGGSASVAVVAPLVAYIKHPDTLLTLEKGEVLTALKQSVPVRIERFKGNAYYIEVQAGLKGWVKSESVSFVPPDITAPVIQVEELRYEAPNLIVKGVVYDDTEVGEVRLDQRKIYRSLRSVNNPNKGDAFPFDGVIVMDAPRPIELVAIDRDQNQAREILEVEIATPTVSAVAISSETTTIEIPSFPASEDPLRPAAIQDPAQQQTPQ